MDVNLTSQNQAQNQKSDDIKLSHLIEIIWSYKLFIISFTFICSLATVIYAISKPNEYEAKGIYMPKGEDSAGSLSKLAGQFGGIASLAGVNLGGGGENKTEVAIELLTSRSFLQAFIERHKLIAPLIAAESWDEQANQLIYDSELYDAENDIWVREAPPGKQVEPTAWEAYEFLKKNIAIEYESKKGIVSISLTYYSPYLAAEWLELLVKDINYFWQQRTIDESERYIEVLSSKAQSTQLSELKEIFFGLIAEKTKASLLAQVTKETMFETVAKVVVPEEKSAPSRALLCIVGFIFSGFFACVVSLFLGINEKREELYGN
ncbi:MAG: LPS O-antigen length regulator [Arcobacter sp.]|nr:LPS O-antigen length regulator [Arcobacter sp.]|tara:strand:- start:7855 stop:8817 length:963 start_codon:yes stop_codon:yes gene_type:complete